MDNPVGGKKAQESCSALLHKRTSITGFIYRSCSFGSHLELPCLLGQWFANLFFSFSKPPSALLDVYSLFASWLLCIQAV